MGTGNFTTFTFYLFIIINERHSNIIVNRSTSRLCVCWLAVLLRYSLMTDLKTMQVMLERYYTYMT